MISSWVELGGPGEGQRSPLEQVLMADSIQPGSPPSYETCKLIYLFHPLGQKMAEAPITEAQTEERKITVDDAPEECVESFIKAGEALNVEGSIHNVHSLSRVYGIASLGLGCEGKPSDKPLDMTKIGTLPIYFSVFDPLNTAGSLVLNQTATAPDFNRPTHIAVNGQIFHGSRSRVVMNEKPVYIAYSSSAFGFVGRSVYQRALFPLKSFIRSMIADDMLQTKLGVLIAKRDSPGSVVNNMMKRVADLTRGLLKRAQTGQVLQIGPTDEISAIDMQNVQGAGEYSRTNILKNIATAADMLAILLENETLTEGFGEGTEDARRIVRYLNGVRRKLNPTYGWTDNVVQYRAWTPDFFSRMQGKYKELKKLDYFDAFSLWREKFKATWPSLIVESEKEKVETEKVKFESIVSYVNMMLPIVDPHSKVILLQWAADEISENKIMFRHALTLDYMALEDFFVEQHERMQQDPLGGEGDDGEGKGTPKLPSNVRKLPQLGRI